MSKISLPNLIVQKDVKKNCTASVYLESENIKILCYLNGPFFSSNNQINNNFNVILDIKIKIPSYIENALVKNTNDYEINIENILKKHILTEKYPRTKMEIFFEIFEFNINYLPFCLMAASLCLNYAGVEQKGLLTSCNLLMKNDKIEVNPILNENNEKNNENNNENNENNENNNEKNDEKNENEKNDENKETEKENNESDKNILTEREIIKNNIYSRREFSGMEYDEESESFDNEDSENYSGNNSDYEDSSVENDEDADSEKSFSNKKSNNEDNIKIQTSYEA